MKKLITIMLGVAALGFVAFTASADHHGGEGEKMKKPPRSVIHVVTVSWKESASEEDIQKARDGVHQLAKDYDGIKRAWTKCIKAQGNRQDAFVMEFKNAKALKEYAGSDAQAAWYEVYTPVREGSTTFDITN